MRVGNFSVLIPEGAERDTGHVRLKHSTQYTLKLLNHSYDRRCDAQVVIDGKDMGAYRIMPKGEIVLERSYHDHGRFTFFEQATAEAQAAGVANVAVPERGLITVVFRLEKKREAVVRSTSLPPTADLDGYSLRTLGQNAGGSSAKGGTAELAGAVQDQSPGFTDHEEKTSGGITGLTGQSNQAFASVSALDYDPTQETTINLRLVADATVRELKPAPRSNPIPAPV